MTSATPHSKLTAELDQSPISGSRLRWETAQHGVAMGKSLGSVIFPCLGWKLTTIHLSQVHPWLLGQRDLRGCSGLVEKASVPLPLGFCPQVRDKARPGTPPTPGSTAGGGHL